MFYIIETNYVGPNLDANADANKIEISTSPAITNSSREVRTDGWCGTTDDWAVYAHGEYATLNEANAAVREKFGPVRFAEIDYDAECEGVVETYKPGKFQKMGRQETADWAGESICNDITANTTDARIAELVAEYEADANREGGTLHSDLIEFMRERRTELREAMEEAA